MDESPSESKAAFSTGVVLALGTIARRRKSGFPTACESTCRLVKISLLGILARLDREWRTSPSPPRSNRTLYRPQELLGSGADTPVRGHIN